MNKSDELRQIAEANEADGLDAIGNGLRISADAMDKMAKALRAMLKRDERNTCQHEYTHRGGFLWEICDTCGAKWADDRGGKPEWKDPQEWVDARAALSEYEGKDNG